MIAVDRYLPDMKMSHIKQDKKPPDEFQLPLALRDYYEKLSILMERNAYGLYFFKKMHVQFPIFLLEILSRCSCIRFSHEHI